MNKGLHVVDEMNEYYPIYFYKQIQVTFEQLFMYLDNNNTIIWRTSEATQYHTRQPHSLWLCRTIQRLSCVNQMIMPIIDYYQQLSDKYGTILNYPKFGITHDYQLTVDRPDCVLDNRHYRVHNCKYWMTRMLFDRIMKINSVT